MAIITHIRQGDIKQNKNNESSVKNNSVVNQIRYVSNEEKRNANARQLNYISQEKKRLTLVDEIELMNSDVTNMESELRVVYNEVNNNLLSHLNCESGSPEDVEIQFDMMRQKYLKNTGIITHHYVISFSDKENISPELAHEMAVETIKKVAPTFQCVLSTHTDTDNIHTHIIINSVDIETGNKWYANNDSLHYMQAVHDELCLRNKLTVFTERRKGGGYAQNERQHVLTETSNHKSVIDDLKSIIDKCNSQSELSEQLKRLGYSYIKYTQNDIILKKADWERSVRLNTCARKFDETFSFNNIKNRIFKKNIEKKTMLVRIPRNVVFERMEFNRFQYSYSDKMEQIEKIKTNSEYIKKRNIPIEFAKNKRRMTATAAFIDLLTYNNALKLKSYPDYKELLKQQYYKKETDNKLSRDISINRAAGNISLSKLLALDGNNLTIDIDAEDANKFVNMPFFYNIKFYENGKAKVYIKEKDRNFAQAALGFPIYEPMKPTRKSNAYKTNGYNGAEVFRMLKADGGKLAYYRIDKSQIYLLNLLTMNDISVAAFENEIGGYNLIFKQKDYSIFESTIGISRSATSEYKADALKREVIRNTEFFESNVRKITLVSKSVNDDILSVLYNNNISYSVVEVNNGVEYEIIIDEKCYEKVAELLKPFEETIYIPKKKLSPYAELKKSGEKLKTVSIDADDEKTIQLLKNQNLLFAEFPKGNIIQLCYKQSEQEVFAPILAQANKANVVKISYFDLKKLAETQNQNLCFLLLDDVQIKELEVANKSVKYSISKKNGKFNVAFMEADRSLMYDMVYNNQKHNIKR